ncbi:MAG TPA: PAS domain S-box protein [Longimicrobiales bacterium]|nr:PAS domain S-box protein [Longimicrobiales bacterium]
MREPPRIEVDTPAAPASDAASGSAAVPEDVARLRAIFDHTFHPLCVLAPDGVVLEINAAALALSGKTHGDVIGRRYWDVVWPGAGADEQQTLRAAIARAATGQPVCYDAELADGAGSERAIAFALKGVQRGAAAASFVIAEARDVTEAKWAERALRVGEARFAGMIAIASDAIISVDENFQITLFNQGAEAMFGYTATEVLGRELSMLLPHRFRGAHDGHMRHFAVSGTVARRMGERQEIAGLRKDGTEFAAEASISKLDLFGSMVFTVVMRDITARKRAERAQHFLAQAGAILAASLEYEQTLASVAGLTVPELADWSVVYIRQEDGLVRRIEVAHADPEKRELLTQLLRYPLDPRSPHPVFTVLETGAPEIMTDVGEPFLQAISQTPEQLEIYHSLGVRSLMMVPLLARGRTRGVMGYISAQPARYGADEVAVAQDLALLAALAVDNARLYRDAQAAVQARDDMIAVVSHDLGNPLSAIRIGTTLLLRSIPHSEQESGGWKHLEFIRQSAQQMENLINDLLDVKRLEAGTVTLKLRDMRAGDVVHDVLQVFRPIAGQRSIALSWTGEPALPPLLADHERVAQVFSNLVGNAVKFTAPGGRVDIGARQSGSVVLFTVADTGPGIVPEHLPHIFDRFWQGHREGRKGLGLGLAIVRGVVEAHGGTIWCESVVGAGTTFLFTLPLATPAVRVAGAGESAG